MKRRKIAHVSGSGGGSRRGQVGKEVRRRRVCLQRRGRLPEYKRLSLHSAITTLQVLVAGRWVANMATMQTDSWQIHCSRAAYSGHNRQNREAPLPAYPSRRRGDAACGKKAAQTKEQKNTSSKGETKRQRSINRSCPKTASRLQT
jgi:hypothetical protein